MLHFGQWSHRHGHGSGERKLCQQAGNIVDGYGVERPQIFIDRAIGVPLQPIAAYVEQSSARPLAAEHHARLDFAFGLCEFGRSNSRRFRGAIDLRDAFQIFRGHFRFAGHVGHEQAHALVVVMAERSLLRQSGVDQFPIEPAARIVAQDGGQDFSGIAAGIGGVGT